MRLRVTNKSSNRDATAVGKRHSKDAEERVSIKRPGCNAEQVLGRATMLREELAGIRDCVYTIKAYVSAPLLLQLPSETQVDRDMIIARCL